MLHRSHSRCNSGVTAETIAAQGFTDAVASLNAASVEVVTAVDLLSVGYSATASIIVVANAAGLIDALIFTLSQSLQFNTYQLHTIGKNVYLVSTLKALEVVDKDESVIASTTLDMNYPTTKPQTTYVTRKRKLGAVQST